MFLGALGEFFRGLAKVRLLLGEFFRGLAKVRIVPAEPFRALALLGHPPARRDGANHQQLADDGLFFGHADDAGALAQGQGRGHGHGAGAAREHEENQHVFGAHGQDWGDAGGQADGREC